MKILHKVKHLPHRVVHKVGIALVFWSRKQRGKGGALVRIEPGYHYYTQEELRKMLES
jgi:hypothetical protein